MATQSNISIYSNSIVSESEESKPIEVRDFKYIKSKIIQSLIDRCENLSQERNEICFIFDNGISDLIKSRYTSSIEEKREMIVDDLLSEDDTYHIGSEMYFKELPSRFSYYDTETKEIDRYKKYKMMTDYIESLGFSPNIEFNFGPEYEQSYTLKIKDIQLIVRIRPNLFLTIQVWNELGVRLIYDAFFSRSKILQALKSEHEDFISIIRDLKLDIIL